MELFNDSTTIEQRKDRTLYLSGRLRKAKHEELFTGITRARDCYVHAERALADARNPVVLAMADRDALDDLLDDTVQAGAATLRGRSPNAAKEQPYSQVLPDGVEGVTLASLAETPGAVKGLLERAARYLPAGDEVRVKFERELPPLLAQFEAAQEAVKQAQRAEAMAHLDFDAAEAELDRVYERVAGALVERHGKKGADRFFLRDPKRRKKAPAND